MTPKNPTNHPIPLNDHTRRVRELRLAIINGTYEVDPRAVAAALLREWANNAGAHRALGSEVPPATMESMRRFVVGPGTLAAECPPARRILMA